MFSVRIVTADYYMASPLQGLDICQSPLTQAPVKKVPVVRVFGATPAGQKTCLHLHGIFPYLYVPYDGYGQQPESYLSQMAFSIDRALNVALGNPSSTAQHVFKVSLVSGMPFYGYHEKERHFMKIYLYNPAMVKRICELLQSGAIMNKFYQPHEAHIPYLLQLFIDYNLYGMNLINLAAVKFRKARRKSDPLRASGSCKNQLPGRNSLTGTLFRWEEDEIPSSLILEGVEPQSTCELEVDAVAADILNRLDIEAQIGGNPGLQAIWEDEKQRRRNKNETSQISQPESQDRRFVPATESEKKFQKRLQEILKQNDFSVRTLSGSVDYSDGSQEFSAELTLHSEVLSPEIPHCTPANMVEVHKDTELSKGHIRHKVEEALINEEAILNLMENSQTFQPLTQRLSESPAFLDSSPDEALVHLLAGLENDGYQGGRNRMPSSCRSFGHSKIPQNSDDEENEPQIEKEEMELSLVMSQRWDSNIEEHCAKKRSLCRNTHRSSTEEDDSSSEEEMEWSNNSLLLANLSIPQLDGTADENSDNPLNNENSRTHSSVIATSKLSVKPSIFHKDAATLEPPSSAKITFQCKHTSALSSHVLNKEDLIEDLSQPNNREKSLDHSVASFTNESTYSMKYAGSLSSTVHSENSHKESSKKDVLPVSSCESSIFDYEEDIPSVTRQVPSRKYTNIRKIDKDAPFIHMNRHTNENTLGKNSFNFSDLNHSKSKLSSEGNEKGNSTALNSLFPSSLTENCELLSCSGENRTMVHSLDSIADESGLNKLKIRYEEFQEHKTEKPSLSQQAAHYMFFPSVVLSNCLSRPQKLSPVTYKLHPGNKQSRLKINKKKFVGHRENSAGTTETGSSKDNCIQNNPCNSEKDNVLASDLIKATRGAFENKTSTDSFVDCHFGEGALETEQSFGLYGNKYTLRAKRKVNYENEDSESSFITHNSKISLPHPMEIGESLDGTLKSRKRRKMSKKLPPVIIKYIIINRFRGRKNMLVKLGKIDSKEKQVILTEEKMELYKKLAPLKDFWPKVPDSPATKYPIYPLTPKKSHRRKSKHKSAKKKTVENYLRSVEERNLMSLYHLLEEKKASLDTSDKKNTFFPQEIGGRLLMVETRLPNDLAEFEGDFSLEGLRLWKTAFSAMTQNPRPGSPPHNGQAIVNKGSSNSHKMVEDKKIVIMPCKCAPSRQLVHAWLQAKEEYERSKKLSKTEPTGVVKSDDKFSSSVNPDDKPVVPPKMDTTAHILPTTAHTKEDVDNSQITLQAPTTECSRTASESQMLPPLASADDAEKEEDDDDDYCVGYSSPDSPVIPPWQEATSPDAKTLNGGDRPSSLVEDLHSLTIENFLKPVKDGIQTSPSSEPQEPLVISPINVRTRTGLYESLCLHSTPIIQRKLVERLPEATGLSPLSTEPKTQKLSHKKGSNTDAFRRVLLTQAKNQCAAVNTPKKDTSQIDGPSLNNTYGFKVSVQNLQEAKALHEIQNLTLISVELHARTRRDLEPDPEFDPICALFYCISSDTPLLDTDKTELTGVIVIDKDKTVSSQDIRYQTPLLIRSGITGLEVTYAADEKALFQEIAHIIKRYDPDILLGYEIQMHSWGYLLQRAAALSVDLCQMISRVPDDKVENRFAAERDDYGSDTMSEINIVGRITLNLWRIMRNEVALTNYTFENVSFHVLHQRFPLFTFRVLSDWFDNKTDLYRWKMVDHYVSRVRGNLQMLEQLDVIGKTSEMARLFGIQFLHVLTRGSQYRVESMMLRIAKPMNYIPVTPSVQQRSQMRAPQCVPLIMEPESRFYSNSVLVLDFQSLYPSIVIAYNYCFSTCLGHVENLGKYDEFKFGCTSLRVPPDLLYQIRHDITVSPNGIAFVKPSVRKGVLPRMLEEILKTRLMVKQSMKAYKQDRALSRMLDARQLGLKLIANVTFGYTAANFSGRMPCIEVGDSIVHKARETLEQAIKLVNDTKKWGARVVYGDTDSMFVLLKGATKEQSFKIGQEIAEAVTATNPKPVKLKFEKVYLPCVLQTKKRYVGYMYETLDQKDPVFDAKGIETVRRDSCPAVSKILERSLKLLFETRDISLIKQYVQRQCMKLLEGKASIQDFIFAKEYRGSASYKPGACVPALELTRKMLTYDRRSEPRVGERVPYVIIYGTPGVPLIQLVRRPVEVLQDPTLRLNATYYITKQILPPLARIFSLIGIDVFNWYHELPRIQKATSSSRSEPEGRKGTISQYFTTLHCPVCDDLTQHGICSNCRSQPQHVAIILNQEIRELERQQEQLVKICKNCTGCLDRHIPCVSLNCPVLYKVSRVNRELSKAPYLRQLLDQF
nr:DNA polymerase zeta catalytic subunit isoform X7 [Kogia breviceps]